MDNQESTVHSLIDPVVVKRWDKAFSSGSDKKFPSLDLVRLEKWYFGGKPGRVLDYGCGSGVNLIYLLECGYQMDGVDASVEAVRLVEKKLTNLPAIQPRATLRHIGAETAYLPYPDNTFDYVLCVSVLSLLGTKEKVMRLLQQFLRVMKPSAKIIVDINGPTSDFAKKGRRIADDIYEYTAGAEDEPIRCYCPSDEAKFRDLLKGFIVDDIGFSAYKYVGNEILEFIACARKPAVAPAPV